MVELLESRVLLSHTWFVANNGNDVNPGTLAKPYRTIQHAAGVAGAGDTVYLRGGTYRETVTPARSGAAGASITYSAYGKEIVTVSGADALAGWSLFRDSIYQAGQSWDLGEGNNQVFVDSKMMNEARWPNTGYDPLHPALATVGSATTTSPSNGWLVSATATLTNSSLPGGAGAWDGATIHLGAGQDWVVQTGTVLHSSAGSLTFAFQHYSHYEIPQAGNHFYLTNSFQALDAAGEWYRDPNNGRLYLRAPASDNPAKHDVQVKRRLYAFELGNRAYINIIGIRLFAATIDTNAASNHLMLQGLRAQYVWNQTISANPWDVHNTASRSGIILDGSNNILRDSDIALSSGNGVWVGGANNTVQNCTIHDIAYAGGDEAGITVTGSNQQISGNTVFNTGRNGILTSSAIGGRINSNIIHDIGTLTTDLGAIYTHSNNAAGTEIAYNRIYNVRTGGFGGVGVYLDNGSSGYVVHDNVVSNADNAMKLNPPSYGNTVYHNTITFGSQIPTPSLSPRTYSKGSLTFTLLGTLGGFRSEANAINNSGIIAGWSDAGATGPAFIFTGGRMSSIGGLGGDYSIAYGINASDQIVGAAVSRARVRHAFVYSSGVMHDLGTLGGDVFSSASAINSAGQVAGISYGQNAIGHAFTFFGGKMTALGTLGGAISQAFGINDAGTIVGQSTVVGDRNAHAFSYSAGRMRDLGTLGGSSSYAYAINGPGQIVGQSLVRGDGSNHAFVYSAGQMRDLGSLAGFQNSVATGINDAGEIVGYCYTSDFRTSHAFLWRNGTMVDLNAVIPAGTGWVLERASAINGGGKIVGAARDAQGNQRAFVL